MRKIALLVLMFLLSIAAGADNEIKMFFTTGQTVYCRVIRASDEYIWDTTGTPAYEAAPAWADSAIDLTENTDAYGLYHVSMPTSLAGLYFIRYYVGTKATAANTDEELLPYDMNWSGSAEITPASLYADIAALQATANDIPSNTEFEARTLPATSYFDPNNDAVASVTLVDTLTTNSDKTGYSLLDPNEIWTGPTNRTITGGTVTTLTNWDKTGYTVSTVSDKTGYSLLDPNEIWTGPTNRTITGGTITTLTNWDKTGYTVSTVSDKTGYSLLDPNDIWTGPTNRILTAGTNIVLAKGTGITGFNDVSTTQIEALIAADPNMVAVAEAILTGADRLSVLHDLLTTGVVVDMDEFFTDMLNASHDADWLTIGRKLNIRRYAPSLQ